MWHTLALALGGRTVAELKAAMSAAEFDRWCAYYRAQPFDDMHRYQRPAALLAAISTGKQPSHWLDQYLAPPSVSDVDASIFRAFGLEPPW